MTFLRMMLVVSLAATVMGCQEAPRDGERLEDFVEAITQQHAEVVATSDVNVSKLVTAGRPYEWEGGASITLRDPTDASVGPCAWNVDTEPYGPLL